MTGEQPSRQHVPIAVHSPAGFIGEPGQASLRKERGKHYILRSLCMPLKSPSCSFRLKRGARKRPPWCASQPVGRGTGRFLRLSPLGSSRSSLVFFPPVSHPVNFFFLTPEPGRSFKSAAVRGGRICRDDRALSAGLHRLSFPSQPVLVQTKAGAALSVRCMATAMSSSVAGPALPLSAGRAR